MTSSLVRLTGTDHDKAFGLRDTLLSRALSENRRGIRSLPEYLEYLAGRTVCLTLLAGAGSRWVESLKRAADEGRDLRFDPARPRGLFPVRNFLGRGPDPIPIAAYALDAFRDLGSRVIVVRGWESEIDREILEPLGIRPEGRRFFTQEAPLGKPLGHGDAVWQCRDLWKRAEYVLVNFGGDASSPFTARTALIVLDALVSLGEPVGLLLPAARFENPAYPITLDSLGRPASFGHAKLSGAAVRAASGWTNVGLRAYKASSLLALCETIRAEHWKEGEGYSIPGNDPAGREFALDNVDARMAEGRLVRLLASALPEELSPVKSLADVPAFEAAVARVRRDAESLLESAPEDA